MSVATNGLTLEQRVERLERLVERLEPNDAKTANRKRTPGSDWQAFFRPRTNPRFTPPSSNIGATSTRGIDSTMGIRMRAGILLLDTDILTLFLHGHSIVVAKMRGHRPDESAISIITVDWSV